MKGKTKDYTEKSSRDRNAQPQGSIATHHHLPAHEVVLLLESDAAKGLTPDEAAQRLERFGRRCRLRRLSLVDRGRRAAPPASCARSTIRHLRQVRVRDLTSVGGVPSASDARIEPHKGGSARTGTVARRCQAKA